MREGESDQEALARTVKGRIGVAIEVGNKVLEVEHAYDDYEVVLVVYKASVGTHEPFAVSVNAVAWVEPQSFGDYPFPGADQKTVEMLLSDG